MDDKPISAKAFFQGIRDLKRDMYFMRRRRRHYIAVATGMSGMSETNIRSCAGRSRVEAAALNMISVADDIGDALFEYAKRIREAERMIKMIPQERHRTLLSLRYLEGLGWRNVAAEMGYTGEKSVYIAHGWALQAAQRVMYKMP